MFNASFLVTSLNINLKFSTSFVRTKCSNLAYLSFTFARMLSVKVPRFASILFPTMMLLGVLASCFFELASLFETSIVCRFELAAPMCTVSYRDVCVSLRTLLCELSILDYRSEFATG